MALKYIKNQTREICLEAIDKHGGIALEYVKEQTDEMCWKAISNTFEPLKYIRKPTKEIIEFVNKDKRGCKISSLCLIM